MKQALGGIMAFGLLGVIASMLGGRSSAEPGPSPDGGGTPDDDLTGGLNLPEPGGPDPGLIYPGQFGWGEGYQCTTCGDTFATAAELNHHRANKHFPPGYVTFCPYDDEMFFTSTAEGMNGYKMHMQFYHQITI